MNKVLTILTATLLLLMPLSVVAQVQSGTAHAMSIDIPRGVKVGGFVAVGIAAGSLAAYLWMTHVDPPSAPGTTTYNMYCVAGYGMNAAQCAANSACHDECANP